MEKKAANLAARYKDVLPPTSVQISLPLELPVLYFVSGFSHPQLPIIKHDGIFLYEWGLIPLWVKDNASANELHNKTLNAVGETVFEKPSFRKSIVSQRCLLSVNGFFEWREFNKVKYPYFIKVKDYELFSLGCIFESWVDKSTGEIKNTFSILTTPANPLLEKIHNLKKRMPLIIEPSDEKEWVDPTLKKESIKNLIIPFPEEKMEAYSLSKDASKANINRNVPEILNKVDYPELPELS